MNSETMMPSSATSTSSDRLWVSRWKTISCSRCRLAIDTMDGVGASVVLTDTGCELMVVPTLMLTPIWLLETPQTSAHRPDLPADGHYSGANRFTS